MKPPLKKFFRIALFSAFLLFLSIKGFSQLSNVTVDPGPYTPGSTIAATFQIGSSPCIAIGNQYQLFLSDAAGSFASETEIGFFDGFYNTFVNGTIPIGTPAGTGYKLRIKSTTPASVSSESAAFTVINGVNSVEAKLTSASQLPSANSEFFGKCSGTSNAEYIFTNASTPTSTVSASLLNELTGSVSTLNFSTPNQVFNAQLGHYTILTKAIMPDLSVATKAYMLINNLALTTFGTTGDNIVCLPLGYLEFNVGVQTASGIMQNYPGNIYKVDWGDGSTSSYTICDIINNSDKVRHPYTTSSCGLLATGNIFNAFNVVISTTNPFCGVVGTPVSSFAKAVVKPTNAFTFPPSACLNSTVIFTNTSTQGEDPNTTTLGCKSNNILYNWYVDGVPIETSKTKDFNFSYEFPTTGKHIVKLTSTLAAACGADPVEQEICIQAPPRPVFSFSTPTTLCAPATIKPTNTSFIDDNCNSENTYLWTVTGRSYSFASGNANSKEPEFKFSNPGEYQITLSITTASCGNVISEPQTVIVNGIPTAKLSPAVQLCGLNSFDFNPTAPSPTTTEFTGTTLDLSDTYTWTISGGAYNFLNGDLHTKYPKIQFLEYKTYTISVVHKNTCTTATASQSISFNQPPTTSNAGSDQALCNKTTTLLDGNDPGSNTGVWSLTSGQTGIGFDDATLPKATVNGMVPGQSYTFRWTISSTAPCPPSFDDVVVKTDLPSSGGTTTGSVAVCVGSGNGSIGLSGMVGNIVRWEESTDGGNTWLAISVTTPNYSYTNLATTTQFRAVVKNGNCGEATSTISTITVNQPPTTSNAGSDQALCNKTTTLLDGNDPGPNTGVWTLISGQTGITFDDATLAKATVNGMVPGQSYTFRWTISSTAPCPPSFDDVVVKTDLPSNGGSTSGGNTFCAGNNSGSITLSGQIGSIVRWEISTDGTTWTDIGNAASASISYTNLSATTQFRAVVQSGVCAAATSTVSIVTVNPAPITANAGINQNLCDVTSTMLDGNPPLTNIGKWTLIPAQPGVNITDPTLYNTTVTGLTPGQSYTFRWTISGLAPCPPNSSDVIVKTDLPSNGGSTDGSTSFCAGNNSGSITLSGQIGSIVRWEKSTDGVIWTPLASTQNPYQYTNVSATTQFRAVVQSGICATANSTVSIVTVNPAPVTANAGANQNLCDVTSTMLDGNPPLANAGKWTLISAQSGVNINDATQYNTEVTGLVPGQSYNFRWTISGLAPCQPSFDDVVVKTDLPSNGGTTGGGNTFCAGNNSGSITLSGQVGSIVRWEKSTDGVNWTPLVSTQNPYQYTNISATTQFRAVVQSGICAAATSTVSIVTVNPAPITANAGVNQNLCDVTSTMLDGNPPLTNIGVWTLIPAQPGVNITDPTLYNTTVTGLTPGQSYTFRWTISGLAPCPSNSSDVVVKIDPASNGGSTAGSTSFCAGSNSGNITLYGYTGSIVRWEKSTDGVIWTALTSTQTPYRYTNVSATTQFRAVVQSGICATANSTVSIVAVNPSAAAANAGANQDLCSGTGATLTGNDPSPGLGSWTLVSGQTGVQIDFPTQPNTTVSGLEPGQAYIFRWTITGLAPCLPTFSETTVNYYPAIINNISAPSTLICASQMITITGGLPTGGAGTYTYQWQESADGIGFADTAGENSKDLSVVGATTKFYRRLVNSSICTSVSNVVKIVVLPAISNNIISADQTICSGAAPAALVGSNPAGGNDTYNYQWQYSLDGTIWVILNGETSIGYSPTSPSTTTFYRRLVSSAACNGSAQNSSNAVKITVNPPAKAEFNFVSDKGCAPFKLMTNNIKAIAYPDRNSSYTWYADNIRIGSGINFPGFEITGDNANVQIKLVATSSLGCVSDEMIHVFSTPQNIVASYTQSAINGCGPLVVTFTNTSTSLTDATFKWDFGNGTTSTLATPPVITFLSDPSGKDTTYTVTLSAITVCGTTTKKSTVFVKAKAVSVFSPDRTTACSPALINFINTSPGNSNTYYFDFGDGSPIFTTTDKNSVSHTYTTSVVKDYVVKMVAKNDCNTDESSYTIRISPNTIIPALVVNSDEKQGCAPLSVNFYNNTSGAKTFTYTFLNKTTGESSKEITNNAPEIHNHIFKTGGKYMVTLVATNDCSTATATQEITVLDKPTPSFAADKTAGCDGLQVLFKNDAEDGVAYLWDFGDGQTSTDVSPSHTYKGFEKSFSVTLKATNALGCTTTTTLPNYITLSAESVADFVVKPGNSISVPNYTFTFLDSSKEAISWEWEFGDGVTSKLKNPIHLYPDTGIFRVNLKVYSKGGCYSTTYQTVHILGVPGFLYLPNSFMPGSAKDELRIFKAKGRGIQQYNLSIFDKWGLMLYETSEITDGAPSTGWDGTFKGVAQPQGVYFWKAEVKFTNGSSWKGMTYKGEAPRKTGVIYLIR